jgi:hypothetical protein
MEMLCAHAAYDANGFCTTCGLDGRKRAPAPSQEPSPVDAGEEPGESAEAFLKRTSVCSGCGELRHKCGCESWQFLRQLQTRDAEQRASGYLAGRASAKAEQAPAQAKLEPLQPTNAELLKDIRDALPFPNEGIVQAEAYHSDAIKALTELEKRIGGE